jgi:CubicO group peptidase (beta-lactamase class C family)
MNRILIAILFIQATIIGFSQDTIAHQEEDQLLNTLVTDGQVIGISAGYTVNGEVQWMNNRGYQDLEKKIPFSDTTLTRIASIAKPMTAIAVMQLVEKGLIDLDAPIQNYLLDFPMSKKGNITVRHLLSHTSGIDVYKNVKEAETQVNYASLDDAVDVFQKRKLKFEPGTSFFYTTYGYVVLGNIIEKVSGLTFEEYMQQNIWDRADMKNTGVEKFNSEYENKSRLYHFEKGATSIGVRNNLSNRIPGGGFYSTLEDLFKFGNGVLEHTFISEETFKMVTEIHSIEKEGNPYGFGWFLYGQNPNENSVIGHSGEQTGCAAQLMIIPGSKTVVVVLSNTSGKWREIIGYSAQLIRCSSKL